MFVPQASVDEAHTDDVIVTQHKTAAVQGGGTVELATSSAGAPYAVALMLDRLDLRPGMKVLEVGTGTGYNAGLLSCWVGDTNTYSVELDPQLTASARDALKVAGFTPVLTTGDGYQGMPEAARSIGSSPPALSITFRPRGYGSSPKAGGSSRR